MTSHNLLIGLFMCIFCQFSLAVAGFQKPCQSPLGFQYGNHDSGLHAAVSHGNAKDVRLNSPKAWRLVPSALEQNFVQINSSRTILLTGLHIQGHEEGQGWVTGWELETSTDCQHFHTQAYHVNVPRMTDELIVQLKVMTFVSCIRVRPTHIHGPKAALRLELLGCMISSPAPSPVLRQLTDGSWELTSNEERLVSWVQLTTMPDTSARLSLAYSVDCVMWRFLDPEQITQTSVLISKPPSRLVTLNLTSSVIAKCLRTFTIGSITISNAATNECSSSPTLQLHHPQPQLYTDMKVSTLRLIENSANKNDQESMNRLSTNTESVTAVELSSTPDRPSFLAVETSVLSLNKTNLKEAAIGYSENGTIDTESQDRNQSEHNNVSMTTMDTNSHNTSDTQINGTEPNDNKKSLLKIIYFDDTSVDVEYQSSDSDSQNDIPQGTQCGVQSIRTGSGSRRRRKRVVSGHRNKPGEWPWLVSLHYLPPIPFTDASGYKHTCGATLITDDWLVTAGHCFSNDTVPGLETVTNWEVYLGLNDLAMENDEPLRQKRLVQGFIRHPKYDRYSDTPSNYDIALVKLDTPVSFTPHVSPICLEQDNSNATYDKCVVSGWGQPTYNGTGTRHAYTAHKTLMSQADCNATYEGLDQQHPFKKYAHILPEVLCAAIGPNGEDSCLGDSGGPLMCELEGRWFQVGVVASGFECGLVEFPAIYSRVSYFMRWIRESMTSYDLLNQ